jgi:hypothetical protein
VYRLSLLSCFAVAVIIFIFVFFFIFKPLQHTGHAEKQFKNLSPRRPDRAVGFDARHWTALQENDRVIPPGNKY